MPSYLGLYTFVFVGGVFCGFLCELYWVFRSVKAAGVVYDKLMHSIMHAPLRWDRSMLMLGYRNNNYPL